MFAIVVLLDLIVIIIYKLEALSALCVITSDVLKALHVACDCEVPMICDKCFIVYGINITFRLELRCTFLGVRSFFGRKNHPQFSHVPTK